MTILALFRFGVLKKHARPDGVGLTGVGNIKTDHATRRAGQTELVFEIGDHLARALGHLLFLNQNLIQKQPGVPGRQVHQAHLLPYSRRIHFYAGAPDFLQPLLDQLLFRQFIRQIEFIGEIRLMVVVLRNERFQHFLVGVVGV